LIGIISDLKDEVVLLRRERQLNLDKNESTCMPIPIPLQTMEEADLLHTELRSGGVANTYVGAILQLCFLACILQYEHTLYYPIS